MSVGRTFARHGLGEEETPLSKEQRTLRNEAARHREQIAEWLLKRNEASTAIENHRVALRRLERQAKREGLTI